MPLASGCDAPTATHVSERAIPCRPRAGESLSRSTVKATSNFLSEAQRKEMRAKVRATFPARRLGTPADIGHAAPFLMTNPYVTGTLLDVTGGETLVDWLF